MKRMKKILKHCLISSAFIAAVGIGAHFHARILSLGDGLSKIDLTADAPTPYGFDITPRVASFIYNSLLGNAWHWGADDGVRSSYVDQEAYYILGSCARDHVDSSYTARILGTRINGKDGRVYNYAQNAWQNKGYVHLLYSDIINTVTNGMSNWDLSRHLGHPFSINTRALTDKQSGEQYDMFHYWCRDGEFIIWLHKHQVINIETNITFARI